MDIKLKTLIAVCEEGSFTKASDILALTQPAVSQQIKSLEQDFRITIFDKRKKKLELTPEGELLLRYAKRIDQLTLNLQSTFDGMKKNVNFQQTLTVGVTHTLESNIIAKAIAQYTAENNAFHVRLISDSVKNLYQKMKTYEVDLIIITGNINDKNFDFITLDNDSLAVAVANDNPLSKEESVSLQKLSKEKLILRSKTSDTRLLFESHLKTKFMEISDFNVILELDNVEVIKDLVRDNFGTSILARKSCIREIKKNRFKLINIDGIDMTRQINIYFHKDFSYINELKRMITIYNQLITQ
ncbi:LysR family transcriptional regulator [Acholeplasma equirhinis]|uniref:LysR family transcriptional regulator n=1 Tax=Acholeplasma equirhinis TaxID=555393 RepID=UPI00197B045A|nr:LysR family transcriptional regulator [Acholeplasma equirhinis]MBN3489913.1 LysR family transcriptional regulator [Acholeplasma equirhinis]